MLGEHPTFWRGRMGKTIAPERLKPDLALLIGIEIDYHVAYP